jgi:peptide/nickel transport system substrate-binding protein
MQRHLFHVGTLVLGLLAMLALGPEAGAQKRGGVLRVGLTGEPPTMDAHWTTADLTEVLADHMFEGLYALDDANRPVPLLAESLPRVSRDGLVHAIRLRQGVTFHNGKELTAEDVVASLNRWGQQSVYGKALYGQVAEVRAADKHAVEIRLKRPSPIVLMALAVPNNFAAIYPKEIAERFPPATKVTEFVGTGPFKFVEWKPDQHIRMVRFADHKPRREQSTGYGGARMGYVDEIRWIPTPEASTRLAALETGELDFVDDLAADSFERMKTSAAVRPLIVKPYVWPMVVFNKKEGLMTSQKLRQAWQAALDIEPVMKSVAGGRSEFYRMDSSLVPQEITEWHTKIPGLPWNERNPAKAKQLLQEAGYKGEPIRFMTTQEYKYMYDFALVTKQQLEDVGFKIDLQVLDWATVVKRRANPKEYDAFTSSIGPFYEPTLALFLSCSWPGWTCDEDIQKVQTQLAQETDPKARLALWVQQTRQFYEKVPVIRYGDLFGLRGIRKEVQGFNDRTVRPRFFNVWLDR